jgi:hypothetical protein
LTNPLTDSSKKVHNEVIEGLPKLNRELLEIANKRVAELEEKVAQLGAGTGEILDSKKPVRWNKFNNLGFEIVEDGKTSKPEPPFAPQPQS